MFSWPAFDRETQVTVEKEIRQELAHPRPKRQRLPVNMLMGDLIQRLEDCAQGAAPSTLRLYHHACQRMAELQQTLVVKCPVLHSDWHAKDRNGVSHTFAVPVEQLPSLKHVLTTVLFKQDGEVTLYPDDENPDVIKRIKEDDARAFTRVKDEMAVVFGETMRMGEERVKKALRLCEEIYATIRELRRRDAKLGAILREPCNAIVAIERLADKMCRNLPAVRDELDPNPVTQTKGSTYEQNLGNLMRQHNLPVFGHLQSIKPYPEGHYMLHGERLLLKTSRPVTAPHEVAGSVAVTGIMTVKALDVRPQQVPDTILWTLPEDETAPALGNPQLLELVHILNSAQEDSRRRRANMDRTNAQLAAWLKKPAVHRHAVRILGVGALDGQDVDRLVFLNVGMGHRRGSPPSGINVPLHAVKLGVFEKSRASCYFCYPSMLFFVGVAGYDGNAPKYGVTGFRNKGSDLLLSLGESDYTWIPEAKHLAHVCPLYGYAFKAEMGAHGTFASVAMGSWIGLLTCLQTIIYPVPKGAPRLVTDHEGEDGVFPHSRLTGTDDSSEDLITIRETPIHDALMNATLYQWRTSMHGDISGVVCCPICIELKPLLFACRNGHHICKECSNKLPAQRDNLSNTYHSTCPQCRDPSIVGFQTMDLAYAVEDRYKSLFKLTPQQSQSFKKHILR
ncbi:protein ORF54 [Cyprinid herpesvirus 3]|nr:protein ORF54 [Cyprinid herpesvirus 3]